MVMGRTSSMHGERRRRRRRNAYKILVGEPEGKRPLRRPRNRWEDNIRKNLKEMRWEGVDWMYLAQDRYQSWVFVNMVMKGIS
jgi:hypothetical protein